MDRKSNLVVSIVESGVYFALDANMDNITSLTNTKESFLMDANSMTVIQTAALSGQSASSVVSLITDFLSETACRLPPIRDSLDVQISSTL